ncbi:dTMP kinase [Deinococcus peraridilitoris]|uniref:Thymidylate kinase n=1 Tax=Deinococcus peraridilitoris (strain DSM 19664 / LMG 22246 / CIP 109416 / KR-200) TaxID=937777 RepID=K9ZY67_DEIPD|nr:dTMP kinase [Deinococcus peraridilitoris]AFZ65882.1 thymidylate kinase [Deinococcus peraridilitoris DSM 19664]
MSLFISFEGPEGAGKSTQIARLAVHLAEVGIAFVQTREPGGTPLGSRLRDVVLDPEVEIAPLSEFLLYSASRAQLVRDVIGPALARGEVVLCDRYADSSLAYQGFGRGLPREFLHTVTWEVTGGLTPHITFLLDLDPETGLQRAAAKGAHDRLERADLTFHERVREGFRTLAASAPERFVVLDAMRSASELEREVWSLVSRTLAFLQPPGMPRP